MSLPFLRKGESPGIRGSLEQTDEVFSIAAVCVTDVFSDIDTVFAESLFLIHCFSREMSLHSTVQDQ